jgi:hypothetical protein
MKNHPTMKDANRKVVITVSDTHTVARIYEDKKVVATGVAICSPEDTFDFKVGSELAMTRAMENLEAMKSKQNKQEWIVVNRKPRAGGYVRIVRPCYSFDEKGDVLKVCSVNFDNKVLTVLAKDHPNHDGLATTNGDHFMWRYFFNEVEVIEPAPKKPEYRKITREPKVGDYVRVIKSLYGFDDPNLYLKIFKVLRSDVCNKVYCVTVHSDDHPGALAVGSRFDGVHWNYSLGMNTLEFYEKV